MHMMTGLSFSGDIDSRWRSVSVDTGSKCMQKICIFVKQKEFSKNVTSNSAEVRDRKFVNM